MRILTVLVLLTSAAFGQSVDYNKIIVPANVRVEDFGERLVQLAWKNNPENTIVTLQRDVAREDLKSAKAQWLDVFGAAGNLNEFTIKPDQPEALGRTIFFPRYNFSATIRMGIFVRVPADVRKGRETVAIQEERIKSQKLFIRNEVLKAYNDYQSSEKVFRTHVVAKDDAEAAKNLVEQRFKQGEVTLETYNASQTNLNTAAIRVIESENAMMNRKLYLESLIGVKLEEVN